MVKIVDGEILQDDDPRLRNVGPRAGDAPTQSARCGRLGSVIDVQKNALHSVLNLCVESRRPTLPTAAAPPAAPRTTFDFSAPALRVAPDAAGPLGLPGLVIYGLHIEAAHLLMLAAAGFFMGLRGVLLAVGICEFSSAPCRRRDLRVAPNLAPYSCSRRLRLHQQSASWRRPGGRASPPGGSPPAATAAARGRLCEQLHAPRRAGKRVSEVACRRVGRKGQASHSQRVGRTRASPRCHGMTIR
jgi:hypothetical protein